MDLRNAGVPDYLSMAIVGHLTRSMHDRYSIVDLSGMRNAFERLQPVASEAT